VSQPASESRLPPCPATPNCVSTQAERARQRIEPIPYQGPLSAARERMLRVLRALPRTILVEEEPAVLRAECRSLLFRFVDDVEIDFEVNRRRMEEVRSAFLAES
jgi:uncharacterized protein (DUF1499 family)